MGVQIPNTTDAKEEQSAVADLPKDAQPQQQQDKNMNCKTSDPEQTEIVNGTNGTGGKEVIDVDGQPQKGDEPSKAETTKPTDKRIEDEDEDEEEYKAEEDEDEDDDGEEDDEEDDDDDDDDDDDGDGDDEQHDKAGNLVAQMGLSKQVVAQFMSKDKLIVRGLHDAAKDDDVDAITKILDAEGEEKVEIDATDAFEYTALHHASENGKLQAVKKLISLGAKLELATRFFSCRPIHYAAFRGHEQIIQVLLDAGADINSQSEDGRTALFHAALHNHEKCVKVLIQSNADKTIKDSEDKTPSDIAKSRDILDLLEEPAEKKARTE